MRRLSSRLKRSFSASPRRSKWHQSEDLKWSNSGDNTEGNTSKTTIDSAKVVDIFDIEDEVEIQEVDKRKVVVVENDAATVVDEEIEDNDHTEVIDESATQMVDRTPSKVEKKNVPEDIQEEDSPPSVENVAQPAENVHAVEQVVEQVAPPLPPKPKYTKEEKQRRFLKELFRIANRHIKDGPTDGDSIVSSEAESVASVPPPSIMERFLHWFSCTANFHSGAILDADSPCPCNKDHKAVSSPSEATTVVKMLQGTNEYDDGDSLDRALAGMCPPSPSDLNHADEKGGVVNLPIASPITVQEDNASTSPEIMESDDNSVSVKYSVRHVTSSTLNV